MSNVSKKIIALSLSLLMTVVILSGCGTETCQVEEDQSTITQTTSDITTTDASDKEEISTEKKKIVIILESNDEVRVQANKNIYSTLEKEGYDSQTAEITEIKMNSDEKKSPEVVEQIKKLKPHVVIINSSQFAFKTVAKPLEGSGIPVVLNLNIENKDLNFIDADGKPKSNITGLYTLPKDLQLNAFSFLQKISPTKGKKAVFITLEGRFRKEDVEKNLKTVGVELKDYCESKFVEDFEAAVQKYNNDDEVAWMLVGVWPSQKKDGTTLKSNLEVGKWDITNRKKPSITYWEAAVELGMLAGLGVDLPETCSQAAELAVKILSGENVRDIHAVNPRKINIVLNQQNAKDLGINFPPDILASAYKVYKDYEGNVLNIAK